MKRLLSALNAGFAATLLLAPVAIFASPADGNRGDIKVSSSDRADRGQFQDDNFSTSCDTVFVHGFNVVDSDGTFKIVKGHKGAEGAEEQSGGWHASRAATGNGFDFTVGPLHLDRGEHEVQVWDSQGVSDSQRAKNFTADCGSSGAGAGTGTTPCATASNADQKQSDSDRQKGDEDKKAASADRQKGDEEARKSREDGDRAKAEKARVDQETASGDATHAAPRQGRRR